MIALAIDHSRGRTSRRTVGAALAAVAVTLGVLVPGGPAARADDGTVPASSGIVSSTTGLVVVVDDLVTSPAVLDYDHPDLTATGRVRLFDPATQTYLDHSGGSVGLRSDGFGRVLVADDGTFSVSTRAIGRVSSQPRKVDLLWSPDEQTEAAFGEEFPRSTPVAVWYVPQVATSWRFVPDHSKLTVKYPATTVISGVLQRAVEGVWQPAPSVLIKLGGHSEASYTYTGAEGRVRWTVAFAKDEVAPIELGVPNRDFLSESDSTTVGRVSVDVIPTSKLAWTRRTIDTDAYLRIEGRLKHAVAAAPRQRSTVYVQNSKNGKTGWTTIGKVRTNADGYFFEMLHVKHPSWRFRLVYKGSSSVQPSKSPVYRTTRRETRIASFKVSPRHTTFGGKVTVSGIVQKLRGSTYVNLGKTKVTLYFRPKRDNPQGSLWDMINDRSTKKSGAFSMSSHAVVDGYWSVWWVSTDAHLVTARSKEVYVDVE